MGRVEILGRGEIQKLYLMLVQYFYVTQVSAGIMNKQHVYADVKNGKLETDDTIITTKNRKKLRV